MAGDADANEKQVPSWQHDTASSLPASSTQRSESLTRPHTHERASLLEKASKFFQDDAIRDAPLEKKRLFFQSKGLSASEVEQLLSSDTSSAWIPIRAGQERQGEENERSSGKASLRDQPPIITYPEFLLQSQKPPPLITFHRLVIAGYIISGAAATIYGTNKYLLEPMMESLSSARRSLCATASTNIATLNGKLEAQVSKTPACCVDSDVESMASDGALFFSRTAGTQTSPRLSRSYSRSSEQSSPVPVNTVSLQNSRLLELRTSLKEIISSDNTNESVKRSLDGLQAYLNQLPYRRPEHMAGVPGNVDNEDSISRMRAEIRGTKGVLLSARNFPPSIGTR
ncbi:MAG: hypothetical protein Q9163_005669 [Psora crenata]